MLAKFHVVYCIIVCNLYSKPSVCFNYFFFFSQVNVSKTNTETKQLFTASAMVIVGIEDINDNRPVFTQGNTISLHFWLTSFCSIL